MASTKRRLSVYNPRIEKAENRLRLRRPACLPAGNKHRMRRERAMSAEKPREAHAPFSRQIVRFAVEHQCDAPFHFTGPY